MSRYKNQLMFLAFVLLLASPALAIETSELFKSVERRIVQVRVLEENSSTKSAIGSGFFVGPQGNIITNFHVVSQLVFHPDKFRIDVLKHDNSSLKVKLIDIDVVHDLAILKADVAPDDFFELKNVTLSKGERLYSIGNPRDLGLTIVEGTYNGLIEKSLYSKIHFTGSINPGMSGGPTLTGSGSLVGVNVSTAGNEMSFLVPEKYVASLFNEKDRPKSEFIKEVGEQLLANQNFYVEDILKSKLNSVLLGNFSVPAEMNKAFHCWGSPEDKDKEKYDEVNESCSTQDEIYLSESVRTGSLEASYVHLTSNELNPFQFASTVERRVSQFGSSYNGTEEHFTNYKCTHDFVDAETLPLRASLCVRAYKKFPELYDAHLFFVSLASDTDAIGGDFEVTGLTFENIQRISKHFLSAVQWKHS